MTASPEVGMTAVQVVRARPEWLALREAADAAARSRDLVQALRPLLPADGVTIIHDLGSGTGSMTRWLAPQLRGPQHWVLVDRDTELLCIAGQESPPRAADGAPVTVVTRRRDITRLGPGELSRASLVTVSAVLDMLTERELDRLLTTCAEAGCPVLLALSVTGHVDLAPADPLDRAVEAAFNTDQRRATSAGSLLGPDAFDAAVAGLERLGMEVLVRPSPWTLGTADADLAAQWFTGWLGAAVAQRPALRPLAESYRCRRLLEAGAGRLEVTVHHQDLLALPG